VKTMVVCTLRLASYLVLLALSFGTPAAASLAQKRVLVLLAERKDLPAQQLTVKGVRSALESSELFAVELFTEYMDLSRFTEPQYKEALARLLAAKYSGAKPDLIIAVYPLALDFMENYGQRVFPGTPIVAATIYESVAEELERTGLRQRVTGVIFKADIGDIIPVARTLKPGIRRIALVGGSSVTDKRNSTIYRNALRQYEPELEVMELTGLDMPQVLERVSSLPAESIVLYSTFFADGRGRRFIPREALSMVSHAANVPVFGLFDTYLGHGIVGGRLLSFEAQGKKAAELALRILAGESPADIPFATEDTQPYQFDWRELKRWGISEKGLPPGSIVRFKEFSPWELYRWYIVGILSVCVIEGLLIFGLLVNRRKRLQAETEVAASERRYRTVAEYTYDWEYWSAPDGTMNYVSPSCERITGYMPQEFVDNPSLFREIIIPEDRPIWDNHSHDAGTEVKSREIQFRVLTRNGETRWIEHVCQPVMDHRGEFVGIRASNRDVTARKLAEETVRESERALRQQERDLRTLTGRLLTAQEEERDRLARELHDDMTQRLAVAAIDMGKLEEEVMDQPRSVLEKLRDAKNQVVKVCEDVHGMSRQLHPSILNDLGLVRAVESECKRFSSREGIDVAFTEENVPGNTPRDISLCLYRIIQEGLRNIAKHACATHVSVSLKGGQDGLVLTIQDNGIGLDPQEIGGKLGLGFGSMRERARLIHGELSIRSEPGHGTGIEVIAPMRGE
jgi:PAS domain S-box-containing protein